MTTKWRRRAFIASFILPTLALYCVFTVYPIIRALYISLFHWSGSSANMKYVGLGNFQDMLTDPIVLKAVFNDYFITFWKIVGIMLLATFFAVALTRLKLRGAGFFRAVFYIPNLLSVVAIAVIWRIIYHPSLGILNNFLSIVLHKKVSTPWLGSPSLSIWALLPPAIWAGIGFFMILLIAAIKSIPASLYESADIDGATQWKQFVHITLPLIWQQIQISVIFIVITSLNGNFVIVSIMTLGGPNNATQVMGYYLYQMGFNQYHMGYASAIGVLILVLSVLTTIILQRVMKREIVEIS